MASRTEKQESSFYFIPITGSVYLHSVELTASRSHKGKPRSILHVEEDTLAAAQAWSHTPCLLTGAASLTLRTQCYCMDWGFTFCKVNFQKTHVTVGEDTPAEFLGKKNLS